MTTWALSVTGAVLLAAIADIVMAEGETKKFIRGIMAVVVLFVMVAPLPKLLKEFTFQSPEIETAPQADKNYMEKMFQKRYAVYESRVENAFEELGIEGCDVEIEFVVDYGNFSTEIVLITVNLRSASISEEGGNIDNTKITETVKKLLNVEEDRIKVIR